MCETCPNLQGPKVKFVLVYLRSVFQILFFLLAFFRFYLFLDLGFVVFYKLDLLPTWGRCT